MIMAMATEYHERRTYNEPGHAHELTFCCYQRFPFLQAERTCAWLAESLRDARAELEFDLWAYVFMPEHVHLIVRPRPLAYEVASILRAIKEPVGRRAAWFLAKNAPQWLPRITQRRGRRQERHFWQPGGGCDRNIVEPRTLRAMIDYVHLNPVRRGLVERTRDWRWSSAAWYEGLGHADHGPIPGPIPPEWAAE
jgi:putative transposase